MKAVIIDTLSRHNSSSELDEVLFSPLTFLYGGDTVFERQIRILASLGITEFYISASIRQEQLMYLSLKKDFGNLSFSWLPDIPYDLSSGIFKLYEVDELKDCNERLLVLSSSLVFSKNFLKRVINLHNLPNVLVERSNNADFTAAAYVSINKTKVNKIDIELSEDHFYEVIPFFCLNTITDSLNNMHAILLEDNEICQSKYVNLDDFNFKLSSIDFFEQEPLCGSYALFKIKDLMIKHGLSKPMLIFDDKRFNSFIRGLIESWGYSYYELNIASDLLTEMQVSEILQVFNQESCDFIISMKSKQALDFGKLLCFTINKNRNLYQKRSVLNIALTDGQVNSRDYYPDILPINFEISSNQRFIPDYVIADSKIAADLPVETKKAISLEVICRSSEALLLSSGVSTYHTENSEKALIDALNNCFGFINGDLASTRKFLIAQDLCNRVYCNYNNSLIEKVSNLISKNLNIPIGFALAYCAPRVWFSYAQALHNNQAKNSKKYIASALFKIRSIFGATTNRGLIEIFNFLLYVMQVQLPKMSEKGPIHLVNESYSTPFININIDDMLKELTNQNYSIYSYNDVKQDYNFEWSRFVKLFKHHLATAELNLRKKVQLEILDTVVDFCNKNNLRYYLSYGTLLGAVRHKGFIPWNDNIDISMPRKDYEFFLALFSDKLDSSLFIHNYRTDEKCWFSNSRIINKNTLLETVKEIGFYSDYKGIGINVWPMDFFKSTSGFTSKLRYRLVRGFDAIIECRIDHGHRKLTRKGKLILKVSKFFSLRTLRNYQNKILTGKKNKEYKFYSLGQRYSFKKELIPAEAFHTADTMEFEGKKYSVPSDWDRVLKKLYGNYSKLPPTKKCKAIAPVRVSYEGKKNYLQIKVLSDLDEKNKSSGKPGKLRKLKNMIKTALKKVFGYPKRLLERTFTRIKGFFRCNGILLNENSRLLASYKDKFKGKRCFLIGNGPSLKAEDLDRLKNEITFGCNLIFNIFDQTDWRPTFYCISDSGVTRTNSYRLAQNMQHSTLMIREFAYKFLKVSIPSVCLPYISVPWYKVRGNILAYHYISHSTVMSMMVELAFYMGFSEIYLLGVDGTTTTGKGGHFSENYYTNEMKNFIRQRFKKIDPDRTPEERAKYFQDRALGIYEQLKTFAEKKGIKIYNATRGGYVEVFERADFDTIVDNNTI